MMDKKNALYFNATPDYLFCCLLSLYSLFTFLSSGGTAFEWPSVDMGPFFERAKDPGFLPNDFFTNTSAEPNPRHIFGYIVIYIGKIIGADWYSVFFLLKVAFVVLIPALLFLFVFGIVKDKIECKKQNFLTNLFLLIAILLLLNFSHFFSIAWWPPVFFLAASQTLCLAMFLTGSLFLLYGKNDLKYFYLIFWTLAVLIHFTVGVCLVVFYFLSTADRFNYKTALLTAFVSFGIPLIILMSFFSSTDESLSTQEFINIYVVDRHPRHYLFKEFGSLTNYSWWFSFISIISLLLIPLLFGLIKKKKDLVLITALFLISYVGAPFIQLIVVEIFPSKFLTAFGPVRFSFLGFWMLMVSYTYLIKDLNVNLFFLNNVRTFQLFRPVYFGGISLLLIAGTYLLKQDEPFYRIKNNDQNFYNWIDSYTSPDAVFVSFDSDYQYCIPLIAKRAIFIDNGFPFSEKFFKEYQGKRSLVFGKYEQIKNLPGKDVAEKTSYFYGNLTAKDFIYMSEKYKLDYIIMKPSQGNNLSEYLPVFENDKLKIYKVQDLKR